MRAVTQPSRMWLAAAVVILMGAGGMPHKPAFAVDPSTQEKPPAIAWRTSWAGALQEARTKKQPVLLVVAFPTCKWWLRMERTTLTDPKIRGILSSMVPVLLHGEDDGTLFEKFKVNECPLIAICDAAGKETARLEGLQETAPFLDWLKRHSLPGAKK